MLIKLDAWQFTRLSPTGVAMRDYVISVLLLAVLIALHHFVKLITTLEPQHWD